MKKKPIDQRGQALIELIIFLPILFILYGLISGFAHSINGSINQQKVTRAYFYYRIQNNSYIPKPDVSNNHLAWSTFSMFFIGWKDRFGSGESPIMPCYRVSIPLRGASSEACDERYSSGSSQWIRVATVYGMCGATFGNSPGGVVHLPDNSSGGNSFLALSDRRSCIITR